MDIDKAVKYLDDNAEDASAGRCARYVREALEAGGLELTHHPFSAKDYGPTLIAAGFTKFYEFRHIALPTPEELADHSVLLTTLLTKYTDRTGFVGISHARRAANVDYVPKKGDVAVIQPYDGGDSNGHITMFDGEQWVSDFTQRDMWGGPGYRENKPDCVVYRP